MNKLTPLAMAGILMSLTGCATLLRGTEQKIKFDTDPPGASVRVNDQSYTSPVTVPLKRRTEYRVVVSKDGYEPIGFNLKAQWDGASLTNVALPGASVWFTTDTVQGGDRAFYPLPKIKLNPVRAATTQPVEMYQFKKFLLTRDAYDKAVEEERYPYWVK